MLIHRQPKINLKSIMMMNLGIQLKVPIFSKTFFCFSDEELLIKDNDRKTIFDDMDSPTKTDQAGSREKKAHVQKVNDHLFQLVRNIESIYY
jgi:hypothetical protein